MIAPRFQSSDFEPKDNRVRAVDDDGLDEECWAILNAPQVMQPLDKDEAEEWFLQYFGWREGPDR